MVLAAVVLVVSACASALAEPLARVDGLESAPLREGLIAAIGQADGPTDDRWRARERAENAAERARAYLRSQGYYAARVDARVDDQGQALVRVRVGERFTFETVAVSFDQPDGAPAPGEAVSDAVNVSRGDPVTASSVIEAAARLTAALHENGFPEASEADYAVTVDHADGEATARFSSDTGPFVRFGDPRFAGGLADLREDYIDRLAPYELGDPASRTALNTFASRLAALDGVAVADARLSPQGAEDADGRRPVDVRAEPAPKHRLSGAVSWSTDEGFGARGAWTRRNLFGGAERATLSGQAAQLERSVSAEYFAPHWAAFNQDLALGAQLAQERTDAFDQDVFRLDSELSRRFSRKWSASLGAGLQVGEIIDAEGERFLTTFTAPSGVVYDGRDDVLDPREGVYIDIEAMPGWSTGDNDVRFVRAVGAVRYSAPLVDRFTLALRARSGAVFGASAQSIPADLRFYAGGGGSVRGYAFQALSPLRAAPGTQAEEPFGGRSLVEGSAELRWRRSQTLGFAAFVDAGAAGEDLQPDLDAVRYGAGLGVRYYPGFGPIRLDIATPIDPRGRDDAFQVYISIGQAF